jgi:hypothetical protein
MFLRPDSPAEKETNLVFAFATMTVVGSVLRRRPLRTVI